VGHLGGVGVEVAYELVVGGTGGESEGNLGVTGEADGLADEVRDVEVDLGCAGGEGLGRRELCQKDDFFLVAVADEVSRLVELDGGGELPRRVSPACGELERGAGGDPRIAGV